MNTLYINYTKKGVPIADYDVERILVNQASYCINGMDKEFQVSTENAVICARMMKLNGKIECNLELMFEGRLLEMNRYCVIVHGYPYGFCDYMDRWTAQLLTDQISIKRKHQEILNPKKTDKLSKKIGVVCVDGDDFLDYRIKEGHNDNEFYTKRKYTHHNVTYWRIEDVDDLCSLALDEIVETVWAKRNPHYDQIIYVAQSNLTSNK